MRRLLAGVAVGVVVSLLLAHVVGSAGRRARARTWLVAEDASTPLARVAIHYAPAADRVALGVWKQLFAVLPMSVEVEVEVTAAEDYARFTRLMREAGTPHLERFRPVVVGAPITTWSRDRYAALVDDAGHGGILAPPRIEAPFVARAGDARSGEAISRALYAAEPRTANIVFEGGDLAATPHWLFADINLVARNQARGNIDRSAIDRELHQRFAQQLVWLGDEVGEVPRHHMMMYMVPLDDHTVAVGDVRAGAALLAREPSGRGLELDDLDLEAKRFDRAAELLAARGFQVVRIPALVLAGAGSYVTYTNALFDRKPDGTRVVYLPTYSLPALDDAGERFYRQRGFEVHRVDVTPIYHLNGSLGCLVNVLARTPLCLGTARY
jgi:hypothetical protein